MAVLLLLTQAWGAAATLVPSQLSQNDTGIQENCVSKGRGSGGGGPEILM